MTVLQCFWFPAWPSVTLGLTLVLSLILLNLGNFVFDGVETKCWNVFFHWHIAQNRVFSTLHAFLFHIIALLILTRGFSDCFQVFALTLCFNDALNFRSAAIQRTFIWAWCLHFDNLTNLTNTSWSMLFSFIFLCFMLLLQTVICLVFFCFFHADIAHSYINECHCNKWSCPR